VFVPVRAIAAAYHNAFKRSRPFARAGHASCVCRSLAYAVGVPRDASNAMSRPQNDPESAIEIQRRLVAALRDPALYPHPAPAISIIETHISFVLLTGHYAYKIKKAVDLGFVDYTNLQRRLFYCEEEIRLNRRLAPTLYLEVVHIGGDAKNPRLGDDSAPIEYAVKMVEFPQDCLLDHVLERNALTSRHIDRLSITIAGFHATIPMVGPGNSHGNAAAVQAPMLQNFDQLRAMAATSDGLDDLNAIETWSSATYRRLESVFAARHDHGFIRECHGDLHLGNMLLRNEDVEVFDGIEFNEDLRWIDVINEVAFLVMDLSERGRPDFGWRFLNDYLEISGDYDGIRLLPFYLVYRAVVRAKVARFRSQQEEERDAALAAYRTYLGYARRVIAPLPAALIIMHGLSGSGKSHVARIVSERIGAIRIRSDVERKRLHGLAPLAHSDSRLSGGIYDETATLNTYRRLVDMARTITTAGLPVVVDAANLLHWQRDRFHGLAMELEIPFLIVDCLASKDVLRQRLVARDLGKGDASEATLAVLRSQQRTADPLSAGEAPATLAIDTSATDMSPAVEELKRRLGR
jgi:aminoglycoside phosphotransferase family enzyme/predicted kinase